MRPIYLERLLQINMATLASLATLLLCMGRGTGREEAWLPPLVLIAAIASVWLTDITGRFRLNRIVANLAALIALVVSARHVLRFGTQVQILGLANLLIYVQIILLFQQKDHRVYRHLLMLSLLQVVVAAIFNQGVWFGFLLVVYMLVGLSALALLCLHDRWTLCRAAGEQRRQPSSGRRPSAPVDAPLTGGVAGGAGAAVGRELFGRLGMIGAGTLILTLIMFFALPRFGRTAWRGAVGRPKQVVGFSDRVALGALGEIIESREQVMQVALSDEAGGESYPLHSDLYLRGALLTHYDRGQWSYQPERKKTPRASSDGSESQLPAGKRHTPPATLPPDREGAAHPRCCPLLRQRITIEPLGRDELFGSWPFEIPPGEKTRFDVVFRRLLRPGGNRRQRFCYELLTTAFGEGVQLPLVPAHGELGGDALLQMPELPELTRLANQWIHESGLPATDRAARAKALERAFHDPQRFQYSLQGCARDPDLDPIEDFIAKTSQGHCEYFATALALMLRSQGIPARVVVGYRCGEYSELGNFHRVRQSDAHCWVEAWLQPEHVPQRIGQQQPELWAAGGWLRLEPTPAASGDRDVAGSVLGGLEDGFDWLQSLWTNYVMEMDRPRQRKAIYDPLVRAIRGAWNRVRDPAWWCGLPGRIAAALGMSETAGGRWAWIVAGSLGVLFALLLLHRMRRVLRRRCARRTGAFPAVARAKVDFYRRLETLLARQDLSRQSGQTQREFAQLAGSRIARRTGRAELAALPRLIADAFYQVRFGRLPLDAARREAVEHALVELASCGDR